MNSPEEDQSGETWTPLAVDLAASTHPGHVRENNEDHYLVLRFGRSLETLLTNLDENLMNRSFEVTGYAMFVADGMGGMAGGEVASSLALAKLVELIVDTPDWILGLKRERYVATVLDRMTQRFVKIDETLTEHARIDSSLWGMGTTLTVAGILGSDLVLGHIGDSRAYLLRNSELSQLTTDHTLATALINAGLSSPQDQALDSMRHVLTSALGSMGRSIEPQVQRFQLKCGDYLLLCTDGLTEMVDDQTIASVLHEASSARRACHNLIDLALAGGGLDNITVIVARLGFSSPEIP
jgi:PPM family protein phosphatase